MLGPDIKPDPAKVAARRKVYAPSTYLFGGVLIGVGIVTLFLPSERSKSPFFILAGILVIVFARYLRNWMHPDGWIPDDKLRPAE